MIFCSVFAIEAKAGLVEKVTTEIAAEKSKNGKKFDPENSLRDHCELMVQMNYKVGRNISGDKQCFEDICHLVINYYGLTKYGWSKSGFSVLYQLQPFKILGRVIADDVVYEHYNSQKSYIERGVVA